MLGRVPEALLVVSVVALLPGLALLGVETAAQAARFLAGPAAYWRGIVRDPWPAASVALCLVGTALLVRLLWANWQFVWATGRKLIVEALHRKVVLVLLLFFVVMMLLLPFVLKTEGSQKSQVQLVLLYSLVLAMVLLSFVAILLSAASICSEVEGKQVQVTDTKPMRRWQFLLGKWFGTVVLCTAVLFLMTGAVFVLTAYLAQPPVTDHLQEREAQKAQKDYMELVEEVLVGRRAYEPDLPPDLDEHVARAIEERKEAGEWPDTRLRRRRARRDLRKSLLAERWTVTPGTVRSWTFQGLDPEAGGMLQVRFKAFSSLPRDTLMGRWVIFEKRQVEDEDGKLVTRAVPARAIMPPEMGWFAGARPKIEVPADHVNPDGTLLLAYENRSPRSMAVFDPDMMVTVLQRAGPFLPNYYRAVLVLLLHVVLLAALGLMAGSLFSFPVASLTVAFFVVVGLVGPWFVTFLEPNYMRPQPYWEDVLQSAWQTFARTLITILPHFGEFSPLKDLTDGMTVTWRMIFSAGAVMVYVKGGLALLIGMYFYGRRELARVIV
jgi:hypothetical protein